MKSAAKVVLLGLGLGLVLPFSVNSLQANEEHHKMKGEHHRMAVDKKLEKLTKKFNLTKDQQDQTKKLLEEKKQKMEETSKNFHEQFRNLLTADQKKKWDANESKEKEHEGMGHKEGMEHKK